MTIPRGESKQTKQDKYKKKKNKRIHQDQTKTRPRQDQDKTKTRPRQDQDKTKADKEMITVPTAVALFSTNQVETYI